MQCNWLLLYTGMQPPIVAGLREVMCCVEPLLRSNLGLISEDEAVTAHLQCLSCPAVRVPLRYGVVQGGVIAQSNSASPNNG